MLFQARASENPVPSKQVSSASSSKQVDVDKFLQEKLSADKFQQELKNLVSQYLFPFHQQEGVVCQCCQS